MLLPVILFAGAVLFAPLVGFLLHRLNGARRTSWSVWFLGALGVPLLWSWCVVLPNTPAVAGGVLLLAFLGGSSLVAASSWFSARLAPTAGGEAAAIPELLSVSLLVLATLLLPLADVPSPLVGPALGLLACPFLLLAVRAEIRAPLVAALLLGYLAILAGAAASTEGFALLEQWRQTNVGIGLVVLALGRMLHGRERTRELFAVPLLHVGWTIATLALFPLGALDVPLSMALYLIVAALAAFVARVRGSAFHRLVVLALLAAVLVMLAIRILPVRELAVCLPLSAVALQLASVLVARAPLSRRANPVERAIVVEGSRWGWWLSTFATLLAGWALLLALWQPEARAFWPVFAGGAVVVVSVLMLVLRRAEVDAPDVPFGGVLWYGVVLGFIALAGSLQLADVLLQRQLDDLARAEAAHGRSLEFEDYRFPPVPEDENAAGVIARNRITVSPGDARRAPAVATRMLEGLDDTFARIEEAADRSAYDVDPGTALVVVALDHWRDAADLLRARAWLRAGTDGRGAAVDLARCLRLARLLEERSLGPARNRVASDIRSSILIQDLGPFLEREDVDAAVLAEEILPELRQASPGEHLRHALLAERARLYRARRDASVMFGYFSPFWRPEAPVWLSHLLAESPRRHEWLLEALDDLRLLHNFALGGLAIEEARIAAAIERLTAAAGR